ncbi:DUF7553 family protein [Natronobiforma cellulositropha]|uniref:DUF7553 family protein n=1 Tax=Natronobiforma cellulositropha TaxID=1679076 RepID=UPI0021D5ABAA|nr:hypothetical protein [Natronobiforma cellulositropha]
MSDHLERAHEELTRARDHAGSVVRKQLASVEEGLTEEVAGGRTQREFDPKDDRLAELESKLDGLVDEADEPTREHVARARAYVHEFRTEGR